MQGYENCELKIIKIKDYIIALKNTWIRRLLKSEHKYKHIFETVYSRIYYLING